MKQELSINHLHKQEFYRWYYPPNHPTSNPSLYLEMPSNPYHPNDFQHKASYSDLYNTKNRPAETAVSGIITPIGSVGSAVEKIKNNLMEFNRTRSVVLEIDNNTDLTFTKGSEQHEYGKWAANPQDKIPPKTAMVFGSQNAGSSSTTGTEGWMWYTAPGVAIRIYWDNPFWGTKKCDVEIYGKDADKYWIINECGSGDIGAHMRYEIYPR